ncbi:hypothetical protein CRG98_019329 [Punica granatum]|uniref:Uncharacterized protein n=1 Tax=Punica granatum TaxID=22663 RepID=A0A2I0JVD1_PUNGR|nr:hypothetical protein CRG98_019329 [Punica granatum]
MEEAEKKRFREMYDRHYEAFGKTYQRTGFLLMEKFNVTADLSFCLVGSLHQIGKLRATTLEKCIRRIFDLLRGFFWNVHRVLFIAGDPLARILCESIKELKDCSVDLLKCTIGYGPYGE